MRSVAFAWMAPFFALACSEDTTAPSACGSADYTEVPGCSSLVGECFPNEGQNHDPDCQDQPWETNPPQSGTHCGDWERDWGVHTDVVPRATWVHNLEHGGIVLLYNCPEPCDAEVAVLGEVVAERPTMRILVTPDPGLDAPRFAAVAWTWIYETDAPDKETLLCFVDQHENHAPEDIP